jgi:hypothetical protein
VLYGAQPSTPCSRPKGLWLPMLQPFSWVSVPFDHKMHDVPETAIQLACAVLSANVHPVEL